MSCPLCRERKGKRLCPAKGERICSACCGSKRVVEIDCPPDCEYLTGAHAGSWAGRETERARDQRMVGPHVQDLSEPQLALLLSAVVGIDGLRRERRGLVDRVVLEAVIALRKTVETRTRGILYQHDAASLSAQGLLHDLRSLFEPSQEGERAPDDGDLLAALQALQAMMEAAAREASGEGAFLSLAARIAAEAARDAGPKTGGLIVPP